MPDDESAHSRRRHHVKASRVHFRKQLGQALPQQLGVLRVLQHLGALQVFGTVQSAGQRIVPSQIRSGALEQLENGLVLFTHSGDTITARLPLGENPIST